LQDRLLHFAQGSEWEQTIVFPAGRRYFVSSDRITSVSARDALFLRVDMPGHFRHQRGDTFSEVCLSYSGGRRDGLEDGGGRLMETPRRSSVSRAPINAATDAARLDVSSNAPGEIRTPGALLRLERHTR
jgi:hypothetical protein